MSDDTHPNVFPVLRYRDAEAALRWLQDAFGFAEQVVYRDDSGGLAHVELRLGAGSVMLAQFREGGGPSGGTAPDPLASTVSIYVVVPDPDAHHAQAVAAGARVIRELIDESYGSREYTARDLEGNLWTFGTYDPYAEAA